MRHHLARRRQLEANPISTTSVALIGTGVVGVLAVAYALKQPLVAVSALAIGGFAFLACNRDHVGYRRNPTGETTQTYQVILGNQERVEHALVTLAKRARRKGLTPVTWSWGKAYTEKAVLAVPIESSDFESEFGIGRSAGPQYREVVREISRIPLTIVGETPHYAGWTFVAVLERLEDENVVRVVPGQTLPPQYRTCAPACGHCQVSRRRNDTYVLRHDDGRYIQVGSSCIKDFLGSDDAGKIAAAASYIGDVQGIAEDGESDFGGGGGASNVVTLDSYLPYVAWAVRDSGWVSRTAAREKGLGRSTSSDAWSYMSDQKTREKAGAFPTDADKEMAAKAEEWAENLSDAMVDAESGDYLHNLRAIARSGVVTYRSMGIAASMIIAYQRAIGRERERAERAARPTLDAYVGEIGKRHTWNSVTLDFVTGYETQYGYTTILKFRTPEGATIVWKASSTSLTRQDVGKKYQLTGTVKEHSEYKGTKQTIVSRCDVDNLEDAFAWAVELRFTSGGDASERIVAYDKTGKIVRLEGKKPKKTDRVLAVGTNATGVGPVLNVTPEGESARLLNPIGGHGAIVGVGLAAVIGTLAYVLMKARRGQAA
jgi:hypothetical protein